MPSELGIALGDRRFNSDLRLKAVSDDGVAFRYGLLGTEEQVSVRNKSTAFHLPPSARAWLQPVPVAQTGCSNTNPPYKEHYWMGIAVVTEGPSAVGSAFAALFNVDDSWLAITETDMTGNYHASRLQAEAPGRLYGVRGHMAAGTSADGAVMARPALRRLFDRSALAAPLHTGAQRWTGGVCYAHLRIKTAKMQAE